MKKDRKEKGNVPNLRFPGFEGEWKKMKLGDVGDVKMCRRIFNDETTPIGEIPFYKIGSFGKDADAFISKELYLDYRKRFSFPEKGDILISAAGTIGRTVVYKGDDAYFQDSNIVWIDNDNTTIRNEFLYYILQIVKYNTEGGTIQRLYNNILKSTRFSAPSISEQKRISNFLSLIDQRIETQNKIIEELKRLKTALVDRLYNPTIKRNSHLRFPEFQEEWDKTTLENITENFNRRNKEKIGYPMYSVTNNQGFVPQSEKFGDREMVGEDIYSYKIIKSGEFAYNPARINVGSIARYNEDFPCMVSSLYVCFKLKGNIDSNWTLHLLKSRRINFYYDVYGEGGVRIYLFYPNFSRIKVSVPKLNEQIKIGKFISKINERVDTEIDLDYKYKCQKSALLKHLFI